MYVDRRQIWGNIRLAAGRRVQTPRYPNGEDPGSGRTRQPDMSTPDDRECALWERVSDAH